MPTKMTNIRMKKDLWDLIQIWKNPDESASEFIQDGIRMKVIFRQAEHEIGPSPSYVPTDNPERDRKEMIKQNRQYRKKLAEKFIQKVLM